MFEMLFPIFMYFIDSILSVIYTWSFQEGRYRKKIVFRSEEHTSELQSR